MKKILLGLLLLATSATINAQIELQQVLEELVLRYDYSATVNAFEQDYTNNRMIGLDDLFLLRYQNHDIHNGDRDYSYYYHFYDADCNLYKRLKEIDDDFYYAVHYIARNVFTTDGRICRLVSKNEYGEYGGYEFLVLQIIDEEGKVVQDITWDSKYGICRNLKIIKVGNKYKLLLSTEYQTNWNAETMGCDTYYYVLVYSCPGNGETTTSVENVPAKVKRNAFPNPATEIVTLPYDANGATSMKIYDMQGKLVERKFLDKTKQELQLNVKDYPSGMYFFEVNGESNSFIVE